MRGATPLRGWRRTGNTCATSSADWTASGPIGSRSALEKGAQSEVIRAMWCPGSSFCHNPR